MTNYDTLKEYEAHKTPVPSYEELQNMNKVVNECMAANIKLVERVKQLDMAETILKELAYGYQSRNQYNKLIAKANKYFKDLEK